MTRRKVLNTLIFLVRCLKWASHKFYESIEITIWKLNLFFLKPWLTDQAVNLFNICMYIFLLTSFFFNIASESRKKLWLIDIEHYECCCIDILLFCTLLWTRFCRNKRSCNLDSENVFLKYKMRLLFWCARKVSGNEQKSVAARGSGTRVLSVWELSSQKFALVCNLPITVWFYHHHVFKKTTFL